MNFATILDIDPDYLASMTAEDIMNALATKFDIPADKLAAMSRDDFRDWVSDRREQLDRAVCWYEEQR